MNKRVKTINVFDILQDSYPVKEEDGKKLYKIIKKYFDGDIDAVIVDFSNIVSLATTVINNSISILVAEKGINEVSQRLRITGVTDENIKNTINLSLSLAQSKYLANHDE